MIRLVGLVNQDVNDLLDAASTAQVGSAGCSFHWDYWPQFIVNLPGDREAVYFRLAYQGCGFFIDNQLLAPASEEHGVRSLLAEMPFTADVIELFRISLPTSLEHDLLLSGLLGNGKNSARRCRTAQDMSALM